MLNSQETKITIGLEFKKLNSKDIAGYSSFFQLRADGFEFYSDEDKLKIKKQQSVENVTKKFNEPNYSMFITKLADKIVGLLETKLVVETETNSILSIVFSKLKSRGFGSFGYMSWVVVDTDNPVTKKQGIATTLYKMAESEFKEKGVKILVAYIKKENAPSIELHTKNGFIKDDFLPATHDFFWMTKIL